MNFFCVENVPNSGYIQFQEESKIGASSLAVITWLTTGSSKDVRRNRDCPKT
jgi:hypothetical protein